MNQFTELAAAHLRRVERLRSACREAGVQPHEAAEREIARQILRRNECAMMQERGIRVHRTYGLPLNNSVAGRFRRTGMRFSYAVIHYFGYEAARFCLRLLSEDEARAEILGTTDRKRWEKSYAMRQARLIQAGQG